MNQHMEDQKERSERIHKALLQRRPRGPRFAILVVVIFAILTLVLAFTISFLFLTTPVIAFKKEVSVDNADPGDILVYTLSYENIGGGDAKNVTIRDTLPGFVTLLGSHPEYDNVSGATYTWYVGTVTGGENGTIMLTVKISEDVNNGTNLSNFATLDYKDHNSDAFKQMADEAETLILF